MAIFGDNPQQAARRLQGSFRTRQDAETAKSEVIASGISYDAVKITDGIGSVEGEDQSHPFVLTAHVPQEAADHVEAILSKSGVIAQRS